MLRKKPEEKRRAIALSTAFAVTGVILIIWLSVTLSRFPREDSDADVVESAEMSSLREKWSAIVESTRGMFDGLNKNESVDESGNNEPVFDAMEGLPVESPPLQNETNGVSE